MQGKYKVETDGSHSVSFFLETSILAPSSKDGYGYMEKLQEFTLSHPEQAPEDLQDRLLNFCRANSKTYDDPQPLTSFKDLVSAQNLNQIIFRRTTTKPPAERDATLSPPHKANESCWLTVMQRISSYLPQKTS